MIFIPPLTRMFNQISLSSVLRHLHASSRLISLIYGTGGQSGFDFFIRLYNLTALTPERGAAVTTPASFDLESFANLFSLHEAVYPTVEEHCKASVDHTITIA